MAGSASDGSAACPARQLRKTGRYNLTAPLAAFLRPVSLVVLYIESF
jgi:hypothetical protein